jgi:hypothetical protein
MAQQRTPAPAQLGVGVEQEQTRRMFQQACWGARSCGGEVYADREQERGAPAPARPTLVLVEGGR